MINSGTPEARLRWLLEELEKRFPNPEPFSSSFPLEKYYVQMIDAFLGRVAPPIVADEHFFHKKTGGTYYSEANLRTVEARAQANAPDPNDGFEWIASIPLCRAPLFEKPTLDVLYESKSWIGCGECDVAFGCYDGNRRCIRMEGSTPSVRVIRGIKAIIAEINTQAARLSMQRSPVARDIRSALCYLKEMPEFKHFLEATDLERVDTEEVEYHGLDNEKQVFFYEQEFYVLSNFSSFKVTFEGWEFDTSEHAYHCMKFHGLEGAAADVFSQIRLHCKSAHEAYQIAQRNKHLRRTDWDAVKLRIMQDILYAKALQHEYVRTKLMETGGRELIENSWRDDFWGWGPKRNGQNMLGKLWMKVRDQIWDERDM